MPCCATLAIRPALPLWLILPLWAAALAWTWSSLRRSGLPPRPRHLLAALRAAATTLLALLLLLPERRQERTLQELPLLAVAVDVSASMRDRPAAAAAAAKDADTRAGRALAFLKGGELRELRDRFRLAWFEVGGDAAEAPQPPADAAAFAAASSRLLPALNRIAGRLQGQNAAGILLLSDGLDQSGEDLAPSARTLPLFALELEAPMPKATPPAESWIAEVTYPRRAVVNWQTAVDVLLRRQPADRAGDPTPVHLRAGDRELDAQTITWAEGESARLVNFSFTPERTGQLLLRTVAEPPPGADTQPANNQRDFLMDVLDPENRVLYLEGAPRWEFKFLKRALVADKSVLLAAFVSAGGGAFVRFAEEERGTRPDAAGGGLPPFRREALARYKVIILGDLPSGALKPEELAALRDFVEHGGGLLVVAGPRSAEPGSPLAAPELAPLLPAVPAAGARFREGRFAVDVTPAGKPHPALQGLNPDQPLPPLLSVCQPVTLHPAATVLLATAEGAPLFAVRQTGQGKSAVLLSDSFWHWRLGEGGAGRGRRYETFYAQLVNWLGPKAEEQRHQDRLQLHLSATELDARQPLTVGATLDAAAAGGKAPALVCRIAPVAGGGSPVVLPLAPGTLGLNVGLTQPEPGLLCETRLPLPGLYTVTVATADNALSASTQLLVREPFQEQTGAAADHALLAALCRDTGGRYLPWGERRQLPGLIPGRPRKFTSIVETALWPRPHWLLLLIALFCAEWILRRRHHLP
ncbi:MAG: hypothetical protein WC789_02195 [Lentisphaeria bacterium]|jgi:uncharacterized membrane protein